MQGKVDMERKPDYNKMVNLLEYNPDTGGFKWKVYRSYNARAGDVAGSVSKTNGYRWIGIENKPFPAHRLAFYYIHKYWPENDIDHINHIRDDNRITNLREISRQCNLQNKLLSKNSVSGIKGVVWEKSRNIWHSQIRVNGKTFNLGNFKDFTEAVCHRLAAEQCVGYGSCDLSSPAYKYVIENIQGE